MFNTLKMALAGALLIAAGSAQAAAPDFGIERLWLDPAAVNTMVVGTGEIAPEGTARLSLAGHWENSPLVFQEPDYWGNGVAGNQSGGHNNIVGDRATIHIGGAVSLTRNFEASLSIPIIAFQQGTPDKYVPKLPRAGMGTPALGLRYVLARQADSGVNVAAAGEVAPGLGADASYGTSKFWSYTPRLEVGHQFSGWVVGGQFGALLRTGQIYLNNSAIGSEMLWGLTAATTNRPLRFEASVRGNLASRSLEQSAEALVGARYQFCSAFEAFALGGPGFFKEPGTPMWRGVLGIAYTGAPAAAPVAVAAVPPPAPVKVDPCAPGQIHTPDQCPGLDDDNDGVKNADDACPLVAGPAENKGCPDKDTDGDGIVDRLDKCPDVPGVKEAEGCPAVDTDGDGILDYLDKCPTVPGDAAHEGCPPPKASINAATKKIDILEKVYFDTSKSTIQARSLPLLDEVATVLNAHPEINKVLVEGHTDSLGAAAFNKKLSADRAAAVKAYLVTKGVQAERLDTAGFGPEKPIADNKTAAGRDQNRRVEFTIQ